MNTIVSLGITTLKCQIIKLLHHYSFKRLTLRLNVKAQLYLAI